MSRPALWPTQPPVQWYWVFPGGKEQPGRDTDHSPPQRVQLYLYSPYGPYSLYRASVPVQGCILPLPSTFKWISLYCGYVLHFDDEIWAFTVLPSKPASPLVHYSIGILVFGILIHFHPTINISSTSHNAMFSAVTDRSLNFHLKPDINP